MSTAITGLSDGETRPILGPKWAGRDTFTVSEVGEILRISRWSAYQAVKRGEIQVVWIGRRAIVPRCVLEHLLSAA